MCCQISSRATNGDKQNTLINFGSRIMAGITTSRELSSLCLSCAHTPTLPPSKRTPFRVESKVCSQEGMILVLSLSCLHSAAQYSRDTSCMPVTTEVNVFCPFSATCQLGCAPPPQTLEGLYIEPWGCENLFLWFTLCTLDHVYHFYGISFQSGYKMALICVRKDGNYSAQFSYWVFSFPFCTTVQNVVHMFLKTWIFSLVLRLFN